MGAVSAPAIGVTDIVAGSALEASCIRPESVWSGGKFCAAWEAAGNDQNRANASDARRK